MPSSAKMMSAVFGWDVIACVWVTAILVGSYTCIGGLAAVVYTDMIQCSVMIAGCLCLLIMGLIRVGGIDAFNDRLAEANQQRMTAVGEIDPGENELTSLILPVDTPSPFPWTGIYFGLEIGRAHV